MSVKNLQANGVVDDAEAFRKFLGQKGFASSISVGSYSIPYGLDYEEIYQILKLGSSIEKNSCIQEKPVL